MGNGTKFKLSSMFPSVISKIKGMTGKRLKGKGSLTNTSDWSDDLQELSTASKDSPDSPPSPVRTFPQNRDRDIRYCSSPRCSSPVNHKSYDIRFPTESPVRRGMKSRPVSPPRRSANSTDSGCCSFDSTLALVPQDRVRRAVPPLFGRCLQRSKCNSLNSDTHSDSELDLTDSEPQSARAHLRVRTMSLQLDGTTEWERERERERDWSEPEKSASSARRRRMRDTMSKISTAGEPSPIHTVRCMPPNTPSDAGNYSDPRDIDLRSACPDFSREVSTDHNVSLKFDRKLSFTDDNRLFDDTYTSFSSDEDFFKVRSGHNTIGQYRLKDLNKYGNEYVTDAAHASGELVLTEDKQRSLRREAVLAKTVRNAAAANDGWARVQSRFAEEKHTQQQMTTRGGRVGYDRKAADESEVLLTQDERQHAAMCRREASLVKTVLSAKDWARENLRALSKASELEKQAKQMRATDSLVEYESFGLPVIHKEHLHSRGSSRTHSPVGEVEKHTKGRIDYKSSPNDHQDHGSDNLVYEQFSQPLAEYASDFYKNAQTEESDFESNIAPSPWEVEFPSFRSDRGSRRSGPVELSEGPTPRNHRYSVQERSTRTPKKLTPTITATRETLTRKSNRSASPKVQDAPVNSMKPSSRSGSPRRQELHSGKRASSPRTPSSARQEVVSKKISRSQSPRRHEVSGKKPSSNSPSPGQQQHQQDTSNNTMNKASARSVSAAHSPADTEKKNGGNARPSSQARPQEERTSIVGSDSVAVVKASYDPYQDFRESMVEMILENDIQTAEDLEELLQCYLSLNSAEYHSIIVQVFSDIWRDIFDH